MLAFLHDWMIVTDLWNFKRNNFFVVYVVQRRFILFDRVDGYGTEVIAIQGHALLLLS